MNPLKLLIFFLLLLTASCKKTSNAEIQRVTKREVPTETGRNVEIIYSDSAKIKVRLTTPRLIRYLSDTAPTIEMPIGLIALFYNPLQQPTSRLTANYGIRYVNKNLTIVRGNVIVVNLSGDTLKSEELIWEQERERVYTKKFVRVRTSKEIILADGFESDVTFSHYKFFKVKATISLEQ